MEQESTPFVSRLAVESAFALFTLAFGALMIKGALEFSIGWGEIGPDAATTRAYRISGVWRREAA